MGVFLLPKGLIRTIETTMNSYLWKGGGSDRKCIIWKNWSSMCMPKKWGGLGFRDLHSFNLALLSKQAWRLATEPNTMVFKVYKARYFPNSSFLDAKVGANPSFIWSIMMATQDIIRKHSRWRVGDGSQTSIWGDNWLPDTNNPMVTSFPFPFIENSKVEDLINPNTHNWDEPPSGKSSQLEMPTSL
ncbi:uncharacterized protein LOC116024040 [Ipomoea triloba]|uniref:uncharacterized protein LOC116024040 n=1 Tax=Ipomoea triloba TaxID=35885 RepID=UPI00125D7D35|nr:uncharacterized protein LOC116024040 [Ipomoea triloba]